MNLFIRGESDLLIQGTVVRLTLETNYPWDGKVDVAIDPQRPLEFEVDIRIPGWARGEPLPGGLYAFADHEEGHPLFKLNGRALQPRIRSGYARIRKLWKKGDRLEVQLPMAIRRVTSRPEVAADLGRTALVRGPLVYCFEAADNDGRVLGRSLPNGMNFTAVRRPELLTGVTVLEGRGPGDNTILTAVPYFAWSHRGPGEMAVWLDRTKD